MAKFFKQVKGQLIEYDGENDCLKFNKYKYGTLNPEPYELNEIPTCNVCGDELLLQKKKGYFLILGCCNDKCETRKPHNGRGKDIKLKAFLPKEIYEQIKQKRKHTPWITKEYWIKKGYSEDEALEQLNKIKENISNKNKGHNKEYFINKFGDKYTTNLRKKSPLCKEYWIERGYNENEAIDKIKNLQKNNSSKVKNYFKPTREALMSKGIDPDKHNRSKSRFCLEFWIKRGYTEYEAKQKISDIQHNISLKNKNHVSNKTVSYWLKKGYTEDEAKQRISELQSTFSLEKCIEKYGESEGYKHWKERQEKWQKSLHENGNLHIGYSGVSQELFNELLKYYPDDEKDYVFYASKNREYSIKNPDNNYYYAYDFTDLNRRKIIEFNGDIYHGNPNKFKPNDTPNPFYKNLTTDDIHKKDEEKLKIASTNGFDIMTVWENDYRTNKNNIIEKTLAFLGYDK